MGSNHEKMENDFIDFLVTKLSKIKYNETATLLNLKHYMDC